MKPRTTESQKKEIKELIINGATAAELIKNGYGSTIVHQLYMVTLRQRDRERT